MTSVPPLIQKVPHGEETNCEGKGAAGLWYLYSNHSAHWPPGFLEPATVSLCFVIQSSVQLKNTCAYTHMHTCMRTHMDRRADGQALQKIFNSILYRILTIVYEVQSSKGPESGFQQLTTTCNFAVRDLTPSVGHYGHTYARSMYSLVHINLILKNIFHIYS